MRRPPLGPVPPKAHDMAREYRWLAALHPVFPARAAAVPALRGRGGHRLGLLRHGAPPRRRRAQRGAAGAARSSGGAAPASARRSSTRSPICTPSTSRGGPLAALGKPAGFVERQVRGWTERWQASKLDDAARDGRAGRLADRAHLPPDPDVAGGRARRLQAGQRAARPARPRTPRRRVRLGDERARRSAGRSRHPARLLGADRAAVAARRADDGHAPAGLPHARRRSSIATRSARAATCPDIDFYETFALFKIAVVIQQIFYRYKRGQTEDERFANFGERVEYLARHAVGLAGI